MQFGLIIFILGGILIVYSSAMVPALIISLIYGTGGAIEITLSIVLTLIAGISMALTHREETGNDITPRDGFLIVSGSWFLCSLFGALPFFIAETFVPADSVISFSALFTSFTNSFFESASGLTTTGASVLDGSLFDKQPHGIMFWRSMNHWLGGMGIIVLSLAILPLIGAGGMQLFKAEVPGPVKDRLKPRIADTAFTLSKVYILITLVQTIALCICGMDLYESLCHTFGTVATGGFSTRGGSVGEFNSTPINLVITFFMIIAGANFALHYRFLKGEYSVYWKSGEFKVYIYLIGGATALISMLVFIDGCVEGLFASIEHSLFLVVSLMTTTGYGTENFEQWPELAQMIFFFLMFVGGCAGSTGGGMKVIRIVLLAKIAYREMVRLLYPTSVVIVKQDKEPVSEKVLYGISGYFILVGAVFILSALILSAFRIDFVTSMSATAACLFNIGPGLGEVGPYDNYANLPNLIKWWLAFCMIAGRLELYSVLILTAPNFWRR
jgi:trk system potassium uptake protein TrkH